MTADPWAPPSMPALQYAQVYRVHAEIGPGDQDAADLNYRPRPTGFVQHEQPAEVEPLLWDGDDS